MIAAALRSLAALLFPPAPRLGAFIDDTAHWRRVRATKIRRPVAAGSKS